VKNRLRQARQAKGWTQAELAKQAGMSQRLVSSLEGGDRVGSVPKWTSLAQALDVTVGWLTGEVAAQSPSEIGPAWVLQNENSPPGLRQLATDKRLVDALEIQPEEWEALMSVKPPGVLTKSAYVVMLHTIRDGVNPA
jgi:transcriptional regulator with XRE-family HTH domain